MFKRYSFVNERSKFAESNNKHVFVVWYSQIMTELQA